MNTENIYKRKANSFNVLNKPHSHKKIQLKSLHRPCEAVNEFKNCYDNSQLELQKADIEECLLKLNKTIRKAEIYFKTTKKTCPINHFPYFYRFKMEIFNILSEKINSDPSGALSEPFEKFIAILNGDEEEKQKKDDRNYKRTNKKPQEKKEMYYESLLELINESYERVIQGINACLFSSSKGIYSHNEVKNLFSFIDTASVQFRSIKQSFPKEFYQELEKAFEGIKEDFENFKSMVPEKYKSQFYEAFDEFGYVLNTITSSTTQTNLQTFNEERFFDDLASLCDE